MPPWAAMEWARRGESWKVKTFTLYPRPPSVAAAARAGQAGADDDDVELPLVVRVDELDRELVVVPLLLDRALGDLGVERDRRHQTLTTPASTAIGNETFPTTMIAAKAGREVAAPAVEPRVVPPHRSGRGSTRRGRGGSRGRCWRRCRAIATGMRLRLASTFSYDRAPVERVAGAGPGQVEEVPDDEEADDHAAPAHRAARVVGGHVVAPALVAGGRGPRGSSG